MQTADPRTRLPFLLNFEEPADEAEYDEAIAAMDLQRVSYDPQTQRSTYSDILMKGTRKTYTKDTGVWADDTKCTDT